MRPVWLALCLVLGAALGLVVVRLRASGPPSSSAWVLGIAVGALIGAGLGLLPGPALRVLRRRWAAGCCSLFTHLANRNIARSRRYCEQQLGDDPHSLQAQTRLAAALWLQGSRDQAAQMLQRLVQPDDAPALARHNYAAAHAAAGRHARAVEELERARPHMSESTNLLWNLGLSRWRLGQLPEGAQCFEELLRLDPSRLNARNALALVLARQGEIDRAIAELDEVPGTRRRDPDVLCNLGIIHQARGDVTVAARHFTGALRRDPGHVAARYNRGVCAMLQGRYHAAIEDLSDLGRCAPDHAWGLVQKGICWYRLSQTGRALEAVRRAMRVGSGDFQVRYNAGTLMVREGMVEQAIRELERAYEVDPRNVDVVLNLGVATHLTGRLRLAHDHFRAAVRLDPRHALARYNCAIASYMLDMFDQAEEQLDDLVGLYPDFPEVFNAIGVVRLLQDELVEAAEQFRRAADATPRSAIVRANLGLTYYLEGDLAAALEQARFAVSLDPEFAAAHDLLGHVAIDLKNTEEGIGHFRTLVRLEPSNPDAHANLGLAYYKDDRLNEAIESYKRVLVFSPRSPEGHNDLGLAYAKNKMLAEAAQHLGQVIEWRPSNPIAHSNLGLVYFFKGETENAVGQWREVTRLSPAYARMREATRFSAYDDQEMVMRPIDRRKRATQFPFKVGAFRHSFQLALDEDDYQIELPWPDLAAARRWQERARRARQATLTP